MDEGLSRVNDICWGYRQSRVLELACRIGLFEAINNGCKAIGDICAACRTKPVHTEKLLIACCALGLAERDGKQFSNTEVSAKYLVPSSKYYQGNIILHSANVRRRFDDFAESIYIEPKEKETDADKWEHFIRGMDNIASTGRADTFLSSVDLTGKKKMLDIGGGPGSYSIAACQKYQDLKAVLWDLPETVTIAKQYIAKAELENRITVQQGDWNNNSFGEGYDVVVMSNILHGPGRDCPGKLSKAFNALIDGGTLAIQEFLLNDKKDGPVFPALFNVMVGTYCKSELLAVINEAGFSDIKIVGENKEIGSCWLTAVK